MSNLWINWRFGARHNRSKVKGEERMKTYTLMDRRLIEVNTDPQRRCYNGCHAKSEMVFTSWEILHSGLTLDKAEEKLQFWRGLNDYAVSQRGKANTLKEFKIVESTYE